MNVERVAILDQTRLMLSFPSSLLSSQCTASTFFLQRMRESALLLSLLMYVTGVPNESFNECHFFPLVLPLF